MYKWYDGKLENFKQNIWAFRPKQSHQISIQIFKV